MAGILQHRLLLRRFYPVWDTSPDWLKALACGAEWVLECGHQHPMAKLSNEQVREIRGLLASGMKHIAIAERFGVDRTTITAINRGKNWGTAA